MPILGQPPNQATSDGEIIKMKFKECVLVVLLLFVVCIPQTYGQDVSSHHDKIKDSTEVLRQIMAIPESAIPPNLLTDAHAVVVIPEMIKAGFVVGGRYGTGVMIVRGLDNIWHYPVLVSLAGGSIGWQIGAQSTDVILVFKSMKSVKAIEKGKFTLGADASVAAGPVGRHIEASTDIKLQSEIYSYSRSRGLFAGVALEGSSLSIRHEDNWALYSLSVYDLLNRIDFKKVPDVAKEFRLQFIRYIGK